MEKIKNILKIIIITIIVVLALQINANAVITSTDKVVETGENVTITIKSRKALGAYTINLTDAGGLTLISSSGEQVSADYKTISGSSTTGITNLGTYTFKTPSVSKDTKYNVKFIIKGMETPDLESLPDEVNTATVTVKAKQTTPTPTPTPDPTPTPTPTPTPSESEPTFTSTNKTMYVTGKTNLRASWSTSSSATVVEKGTELTVTGTSTQKVNGYVWYRVSYNGQTKYVSSSLLTSTKPEEDKKTEETTKSNNANLKSLEIANFEFTPSFNADVTQYTLEVTNNINELEIKAEAEDSKATVTINGEKDLKNGENSVTIKVNAEDGTVKIYEIKVTKTEAATLGLKSLKIAGTNIETNFKEDVFNYEVEINEDLNKLDIEAVASEEGATIEILGNENLQEGENVITIIVTSKDGENKATYQVKVTKELAKVAEAKTTKMDPKVYMCMGIAAAAFIALIIVIVYTVKTRKINDYGEEAEEEIPDKLPERKSETVAEKEENQNKEEKTPENKVEDRKNYFLDVNQNENGEEADGLKRKRGKHF